MKTKNLLFAFLATTTVSQGDVLVEYQFNDPADYNIISGDASSARVTWNATSTAADVTASIYQGVGLQLFANGGLNDAFTSSSGAANLRANPGDSETFTLTAGPGLVLDLENITFDLTAGNAATAYHVDAIADGGAAVTLLASTTDNGPFDLDLTVFGDEVGEIEFQIIIDVFNTSNMRIDNVIVNGAVVSSNDSDGDGLNDLWEDEHFGDNSGTVEASDLTPQDGAGDGFPVADGDGATNEQEETAGTDPNSAQSDGDTLNDGDEINIHGTNPLLADSDIDGLDDDLEVNTSPTDPLDDDSDDDGLLDGEEDVDMSGAQNGSETDPVDADSDDDGVCDGDEVNFAPPSDPLVPDDTDGDLVPNAIEDANVNCVVDVGETDPLNPDSDGDNLTDGSEDSDQNGIVNGSEIDPTLADSDEDGIDDDKELAGQDQSGASHGFGPTDPILVDSDVDNFSDSFEIDFGTDPNDDQEFPFVLVENNFNDFDLVADSVALGVIAEDVGSGSALTIFQNGGLPNAFVSGGTGLSDAFADGDSALLGGQTFTFGVSGDGGATIDLAGSELTFSIVASVNGAANYAVYVDVDSSGTFALLGDASYASGTTFKESLGSLGVVSSLDVQVALFNKPNSEGTSSSTVLDDLFIVGGSIGTPENPYDTWAVDDGNAPTGGPDDDFDLDGVANALELVLGGDKDTNDLDKLPGGSASGGSSTFTFVRDQDSVAAGVSVVIEVSTDLANWPDTFTVGADTASSTPGVTVTDNLDGTDTVELTAPQGEDDKRFARLKVVIAGLD